MMTKHYIFSVGATFRWLKHGEVQSLTIEDMSINACSDGATTQLDSTIRYRIGEHILFLDAKMLARNLALAGAAQDDPTYKTEAFLTVS